MGLSVTRPRTPPRSLGIALAVLALVLDQGHKLWMLRVFDIAAQQPVALGPYLDLVLAWNPGISYSLLSAKTDLGRWLLLGVTLAATLALAIWLWRTSRIWAACGLGLIVGGALGNAYDRFAYGAVADFFHIHIGSFSWYVFNVADCAIVVGVALLILDSFWDQGTTARHEMAEKPN